MGRFTATNEDYLRAYSESLKTSNKTQLADYTANLGDETVPISYDMFFDFLMNKIVLTTISNHEFTDPLSKLYNGSLSVGKYIEDKRTILAGKENEYSTKEFVTDITNPYIKEKSGISVVYHRVNKHRKIKRTVSYDQIQEALLNEGGISSLVNAIINDLTVEKSAWEYSDKRSAILDPDYTTVVEYDDYADFNVKVRNVMTDFKYYDNSYKYNAALIYTPMRKEDIVIIMSEKFKTEEDINFFTGLFNVSYAELREQILYIDEFDDPNIKCAMLDKRGLFFKKTLDKTEVLRNPEDLTMNYFVHFWRMHSVSPHYNAVVFRSKEAEVTRATANIPNAYLANKAFDFTLTVPENFEAYYTTDGTTPTKASTKYSAAVNITKSTTVKVLTVPTNGTPRADGEDVEIFRIRFVD